MMDYNTILNRNEISTAIQQILKDFETSYKNPTFKKGIFIYGSSGTGKTRFIMDLLRSLQYDIISYDTGDVRNKSLIETITSNNISNQNVLQMMTGETKKIVIVMDEIDGMNNGDKGGISSLIKLIRQKKTKKQKLEFATNNPIICIGNYNIDKKIKELMKVCYNFELKTPTPSQLTQLLPVTLQGNNIIDFINGDLRKLQMVLRMDPKILLNPVSLNLLKRKRNNEESKMKTEELFQHEIAIQDNSDTINETDRTIIALLWHENIIDYLEPIPDSSIKIKIYLEMLENLTYADYIDRITFQNQIWSFNEMSFIIKVLKNVRQYHSLLSQNQWKPPLSIENNPIRFTKILTKYSTEYNNMLFMNVLSEKMGMDKRDVIVFFQDTRVLFEDLIIYGISKLDIQRLFRFLEKNNKTDTMDELIEVDEIMEESNDDLN